MIDAFDSEIVLHLLGVDPVDGSGVRVINGKDVLELRWYTYEDINLMNIWMQLKTLEQQDIIRLIDFSSTAIEELIAHVTFTPYGEMMKTILMHQWKLDHD